MLAYAVPAPGLMTGVGRAGPAVVTASFRTGRLAGSTQRLAALDAVCRSSRI